jgi:hypothetical protein
MGESLLQQGVADRSENQGSYSQELEDTAFPQKSHKKDNRQYTRPHRYRERRNLHTSDIFWPCGSREENMHGFAVWARLACP